MKYKWIIGAGIYLEIAFNAWKQAYPEIIIEKIEVPQAQDYSFELGSLDNLDPREGTAFVAFDERFGNFKRVELMQDRKSTRLNSSHSQISYAVFCLKKKKKSRDY